MENGKPLRPLHVITYSTGEIKDLMFPLMSHLSILHRLFKKMFKCMIWAYGCNTNLAASLQLRHICIGSDMRLIGFVSIQMDMWKLESMHVAGWVYRDHHGNWLGGYAMNLGFCSNQAAELWGVNICLNVARARGYNKLIVQIDNKKVVEALSKSTEEKVARLNLISNWVYIHRSK